jgi:hypothetical protein
MSSLPISKYCGLAPKLYAQYGSGRPAAMSTAHHARCAGDEGPMMRLTDDEREEVTSWQKPTDVVFEDGTTLAYADAAKEVEVCLSPMGWPCERDEALCVGHLDFAWIVQLPEPKRSPMVHETKIAYVADIKKSRWTTPEGTDSLQLHAYGMAYAQKMGCAGYVVGIFIPTEGEWIWSKTIIWLGSVVHGEIWAAILASATNEGEQGSLGHHCSNCYARLHCPEWTLPAALASTALAPLAAGQVPTAEKAAEMVQLVKAGKQLFDQAEENLKEWVRRGELRVLDGDREWKPVKTAGRMSWDSEKLESALGDGVAKFKKKGADFPTFRWVKKREGSLNGQGK